MSTPRTRTYKAHSAYRDDERDASVIAVYSHLTFYRVALTQEGGTIIGPGVEHEFSRDHTLDPVSEGLIAVIRFESESLS